MRSPFARRVRASRPVWVRVPPLPQCCVESIRLDEEPSLNLGGAAGAWAFESPALRGREAIRLDEEPCSKHGRGESLWAFESPRFRSTRWGRTARWCGTRVGSAASPGTGDGRSTRSPSAHAVIVQRSGRRALNPVTGVRIPVTVLGRFTCLPQFTMPGSRAARRPAVNRRARVRSPPWQRSARWLRNRGTRLQPETTGVRVPPGRPSAVSHVVVVQRLRIPGRHPGDEGSSPSGHTKPAQSG